MIDKSYLNNHFRFVYSPKVETYSLFPFQNIRFLVGAGRLPFYIGTKNAETVQKAALNSKTDKVTLKFRKAGKIEIYVK